MADELISRQAAIAEFEERFDRHQKRSQRNIGAGFVEVHKEWVAMAMGVAECLDVIRKLPAVDVVEVVRCENCEHGRPDGEGHYYCYQDEFTIQLDMKPDHFCAYGIRREENAAD